MTEEEAKAFLDVPRETLNRLEAFVGLLADENGRQNLVSGSSLDRVWARHIADSAQLLAFAPPAGTWLDLGSGAGFPGLVAGLLFPGHVTMIESRKLRVDFLRRAAECLGISGKVSIIAARAEIADIGTFDVISARAFAQLMKLFDIGVRFSTDSTCWVLPKGRNAQSELEAAKSLWQGRFRLEPSLTDADARIIVAEGVRKLEGKRTR